MSDRLAPLLTYHPFTRLNALLEGKGGGPTLAFSVDEPQMTPPALVSEALQRHNEQWSKYPLPQGTPEFRVAVADWLNQRYGLPAGMIDADRHVLPVAGTREALFMIALSAVPEATGGRRAKVLMPNPFYHVYAGAAATAGGNTLTQ